MFNVAPITHRLLELVSNIFKNEASSYSLLALTIRKNLAYYKRLRIKSRSSSSKGADKEHISSLLQSSLLDIGGTSVNSI